MLAASLRRGGGRLLSGLPRGGEAVAAAWLGELTALQLESAACSAPSYQVYKGAAAGSAELWPCVASLTQQHRLISSTAARLLADSRPTQQQQGGDGGGERSTTPRVGDSGDATEPAAHGPGRRQEPPPTGTWLDRLPASWVPYAQLMRLDKPVGTWLLAWPCFWSIGLAAAPGAGPDPRLLALFGVGAVLLRGAGCTINDLWDRELDRKVERTRSRPLASGALTPARATACLAAQLSAGLAVLLQLNPFSQVLGASSLALVAAYPLMKRVTGWPQAFLGLTFNWGALLGWAAVHGACDWGVVLPLYGAGVCWTLVYDTVYAHQDKADDVKAGIRSTALTFGARTRQYCAGFAVASVALLATAGHAAGCGPAYFAGVAAAAGHLGWQLGSVDLDDAADCAAKFASNAQLGGLVFAGVLADRLHLLGL